LLWCSPSRNEFFSFFSSKLKCAHTLSHPHTHTHTHTHTHKHCRSVLKNAINLNGFNFVHNYTINKTKQKNGWDKNFLKTQKQKTSKFESWCGSGGGGNINIHFFAKNSNKN
jgi:hypothetical protein